MAGIPCGNWPIYTTHGGRRFVDRIDRPSAIIPWVTIIELKVYLVRQIIPNAHRFVREFVFNYIAQGSIFCVLYADAEKALSFLGDTAKTCVQNNFSQPITGTFEIGSCARVGITKPCTRDIFHNKEMGADPLYDFRK